MENNQMLGVRHEGRRTLEALSRIGSEGKASACNAGDLGSTPGSGRSPGEGNGNPLCYFWSSPSSSELHRKWTLFLLTSLLSWPRSPCIPPLFLFQHTCEHIFGSQFRAAAVRGEFSAWTEVATVWIWWRSESMNSTLGSQHFLFERKWTPVSLFIKCCSIFQDRRHSLHLSQGHLRGNSRDHSWL